MRTAGQTLKKFNRYDTCYGPAGLLTEPVGKLLIAALTLDSDTCKQASKGKGTGKFCLFSAA